MFDLNVAKLERLIQERFGGKDESIVKNALAAFHAGLRLFDRRHHRNFPVYGKPEAKAAARW